MIIYAKNVSTVGKNVNHINSGWDVPNVFFIQMLRPSNELARKHYFGDVLSSVLTDDEVATTTRAVRDRPCRTYRFFNIKLRQNEVGLD